MRRDPALILVGCQAALGALYLASWLVGPPYVYAFVVMAGNVLGIGMVVAAVILSIARSLGKRWLAGLLMSMAAVIGVIVHVLAWQAFMSIRWS